MKIDRLVSYDSVLSCYTLDYKGECICLGAKTMAEAVVEASSIVESWGE